MNTHTLTAALWLPQRRDEVFSFFTHRQETVRRLFNASSNPPPASPEASCFPCPPASASRFAADLSVG